MNLFDFYIPEWVMVAFSFCVLVAALRAILWKPVLKFLDDRQRRVDDALSDAEDARAAIAEMERQRAEQDALLERKLVAAMKEARERAGREYDRIVREAEDRARKIVEAGEEKAAQAYENILFESRQAIITLALGAASLVVEQSMDAEHNRELVAAMLRKAGVHDA